MPFPSAVALQQHPSDAFTVFLARETRTFAFNNMHFVTESVQILVVSVKQNNIQFVLNLFV